MLIVAKLGGEVVDGPELPAIARDLFQLSHEGHRIVVTHGGGQQASALSRRLGIEPRIVGGRRITDSATLDVMKMTIAGHVNVDLCARLRSAGCRAVGLHDAVKAVRRPPKVISGGGDAPIDLGFVGDVTGFDRPLIDRLLEGGFIPVLACLGHDEAGALYNINADVVANQLAGALSADALLLVTGVPGVLRDRNDLGTRIPRLSIEEARRAITDGVVAGGMIPKLEESFAALELGARSIYILSGELLKAIHEPGAVGTMLVP